MRGGPTPLESTARRHLAPQFISLRRCNLTLRHRRVGSLHLASKGARERLRRWPASRAATASPDYPVDSTELTRRLLLARSASGDEVPLSDRLSPLPSGEAQSIDYAPGASEQPPSDALPWREGVRDYKLIASTSDCERGSGLLRTDDSPTYSSSSSRSNFSSTSGDGSRDCTSDKFATANINSNISRDCLRLSRHGDDSHGHSHTRQEAPPGPETQGAEVSRSLGLSHGSGGGVADLTNCVFRWLEDSGGGLRHWLLTTHATLHPAASQQQQAVSREGSEEGNTEGATAVMTTAPAGRKQHNGSSSDGSTAMPPPQCIAGVGVLQSYVMAAAAVAASPPPPQVMEGPYRSAADAALMTTRGVNLDDQQRPLRHDTAHSAHGDPAAALNRSQGGAAVAMTVSPSSLSSALPPSSLYDDPDDHDDDDDGDVGLFALLELFRDLDDGADDADDDGRDPGGSGGGVSGQTKRHDPRDSDLGAHPGGLGSVGAADRDSDVALGRRHDAARQQAELTAAARGPLDLESELDAATASTAAAARTAAVSQQQSPSTLAGLTAGEARTGGALESPGCMAVPRKKGLQTASLEPASRTLAGASLLDGAPEGMLPEWLPIGVAPAASHPHHSSSLTKVRLSPPPIRRTTNAHARSIGSTLGAVSSSNSSSSRGVVGSRGRSEEVDGVRDACGSGSRSQFGNMPAALLTWELSHAAEWQRVSVLVQLYDGQLDCIHVSAALVRLAKLHRHDATALTVLTAGPAAATTAPPPPPPPNDFGSSGDAAKTSLGSNNHGSESSNTSGARFARAWAKARARALAAEGTGQLWLVTAEQRRLRRCVAEQHAGGVRTAAPSPTTTAAVAGGAAATLACSGSRVLHPDVAHLLDSLFARVPGLMPRACYRTVSNMLWALGVLQPLVAPRPRPRRGRGGSVSGGGSVPRVAATAAVLAAKMRHFWQDAGPLALALALWGLARLGLRPGPVWVSEFEYASVRLLPRFNSRELGCSLWALATLRLRPDALWLASAQRAAVKAVSTGGGGAAATGTNLRFLATVLWSFAILRARLDGPAAATVLAALAERLQVEGAVISGPQVLCMTLWGCARLGLRPQNDLLAAWRRAASGAMLSASPARAVSCMLWSLARLRCAPPGGWVDEAAAALLARAREGRLGCQSLCVAVGSLAQLDARVSSEWLRAFSAAAAPLLRQLDPSELGVVLHGLGRLAGDGSAAIAAEFLTAADAAAAAALPTASARDMAGIGGGLASFGATRSPRLHRAFVQHTAELLQMAALEQHHAAACLQYLAASARCSTKSTAATSVTAAAAAGGADVANGADDGTRELCYDAVRAHVPDDTKQPLPPPQPPPPPPRKLVMALLRVVLTAELNQYDVFDVGQALCAAAELGVVAATPAARSAVISAATRVCGHTPGARGVLQLFQGMYGLRVRPRAAWLTHVASQVGGRLRALTGDELDLLLRLLGALEWRRPEEPPSVTKAPASVSMAPAAVKPDAPEGTVVTAVAATGVQHHQQQQEALDPPSALTALLRAAQPTLSAAPVQHLLQFATALVTASTEPTAGAAAAAAKTSSLSSPPPLPATQLSLPAGWMQALEDATVAKLSQGCVMVASLVELLTCFACLGHAPGHAWTAAWYDSTVRRLRSLRLTDLCMVLHLQQRLGLRPPLTWLRSHAAALMAAVTPAGPGQLLLLPPLEVLAAVIELQRLGLDDATLAGGPWPDGVAAPVAPLSSLVARAVTQLHAEMLAAEPAAQLATLAALQAIVDPQFGTAAPHTEGWAVGVLAMAHSVMVQRPLHQLLRGLRRNLPPTPSSPATDAPAPVPSPEPVVVLLASMARWGHAPDHRWLSGIARHVCGQAESAAAAACGGEGGWPTADAARAVCCLAALGYVPDAAVAERLQRLLQPALAERGGMPPGLAAELCCAWAMVRRRPPPTWWRAAEGGALAPAALAEVPPATLIRLLYSMTQLGHVPSYEWLACYLPYLPAALAVPVPALAVGAHATANSSSSRSTDLANLAWAIGSVIHNGGYPPEVLSSSGALQALLGATGPLLGAMGPGQLVLLVEGLARGRHRLPPAWVAAFAGQVARQLHACGPSDLVSFLYCLAFLDARPPLSWLSATVHRTAQLLPPLLVSHEAYRADDLAWAVVKLDPRGAVAAPFLDLLERQRTAAAAAAPAAAEPPPAWFLRVAGADGGGVAAAAAVAAFSESSGGGGDADGGTPRTGGAATVSRRRGQRRPQPLFGSVDRIDAAPATGPAVAEDVALDDGKAAADLDDNSAAEATTAAAGLPRSVAARRSRIRVRGMASRSGSRLQSFRLLSSPPSGG